MAERKDVVVTACDIHHLCSPRPLLGQGDELKPSLSGSSSEGFGNANSAEE